VFTACGMKLIEIINKIIILASSWLFILLHYMIYSVSGPITFAFLPLGVFLRECVFQNNCHTFRVF